MISFASRPSVWSCCLWGCVSIVVCANEVPNHSCSIIMLDWLKPNWDRWSWSHERCGQGLSIQNWYLLMVSCVSRAMCFFFVKFGDVYFVVGCWVGFFFVFLFYFLFLLPIIHVRDIDNIPVLHHPVQTANLEWTW